MCKPVPEGVAVSQLTADAFSRVPLRLEFEGQEHPDADPWAASSSGRRVLNVVFESSSSPTGLVRPVRKRDPQIMPSTSTTKGPSIQGITRFNRIHSA